MMWRTAASNTPSGSTRCMTRDNLYLLAHFIDPTPLNNPGQTAGDYGFQGDCLQFRIITHAGGPLERGEHFTCWKGRDGKDVIVQEHGVKLDGGDDARPQSGRGATGLHH